MDALLLIDTTAPAFSKQSRPGLAQLIDRARGVGGVIVHIAGSALGTDVEDGDAEEGSPGPEIPVIETAFGTAEEELVLVSQAPDAFEGVEELAPGLDDLGVERLLMAGGDGRGAVYETAMAALVLGFQVVLLSDGVLTAEGEPAGWLGEAEAAGAVVKAAEDVWLKM